MPGHGARRGRAPGDPWTTLVVEERKHQVVRILVLVAVLKSEDLEHRVRKDVRDANGNPRPATAVEALALESALDEVVANELSAADV
jgi:hypothetical protein